MNLRHFLLLGSLACNPLAFAQSVITWTAVTNISVNDTDVVNEGSLVYAYNFGEDPWSVTLNGYTFQAAPDASDDDYTFTGDGTINEGHDGFLTGAWEGMSGDYYNLLMTGRYVDGGDAVLTLNNLTMGQTYRIQLWMNDARSAEVIFDRNAIVSDGLDYSSATIAYNQGEAGGSLGQFALGQFIASDSTQQIFLDRGPGGDGNSVQLNAFAVSTIPEPSTYAMIAGLTMLAVVALRRRRLVAPTRQP